MHPRSSYLFLPFLLLVALSMLAFAACSDGDAAPAEPSPAPTEPTDPSPEPTQPTDPTSEPTEPTDPTPEPADPTPGPTDPTPVPTEPTTDGSTGVPPFDRLIDLMLDRDIPELIKRIDYVSLPCVKDPQGIGGPPVCLEHEADGTPVDVMPFAACEGSYTRPEQMAAMFESQLDSTAIYAAFSLKHEGTEQFPMGEYGILFTVEGAGGMGTLGMMLGASADGEIVSVWRGCAATAQQIFDMHAGDVVLLAPQV